MTTMEPYRRKLFRLSLITCIICHVLRHTSGIHAQQMEPLASEVMAPTSESPGGAMFAPDSSNLALTSSPSFPSSLDLPPAHLNTHDFASPDQRPESGQACTWDVIAATLSDDQLLKKALQVYSSRHGINKMREVIVMATGLVFRPDITESLNSVLPPDMPSNPAPAIPMAIFRDSGESGMKNPEQVYAVSPSPFAEMLRGAINAGPSGVDESGSSHLLRSGSSVSHCLTFPCMILIQRMFCSDSLCRIS